MYQRVSTEIYIQGFKNGKGHGIEASRVLDAFGKQASDQKGGFFGLVYDDLNSCDFTLSEENGLVTGVCIFRPCAHADLYLSIFELLKIGPYAAFTPGSISPVFVRPEVRADMPEDMAQAIGEPLQVQNAGDIPIALFG